MAFFTRVLAEKRVKKAAERKRSCGEEDEGVCSDFMVESSNATFCSSFATYKIY
jgi:hypothetical protein